MLSLSVLNPRQADAGTITLTKEAVEAVTTVITKKRGYTFHVTNTPETGTYDDYLRAIERESDFNKSVMSRMADIATEQFNSMDALVNNGTPVPGRAGWIKVAVGAVLLVSMYGIIADIYNLVKSDQPVEIDVIDPDSEMEPVSVADYQTAYLSFAETETNFCYGDGFWRLVYCVEKATGYGLTFNYYQDSTPRILPLEFTALNRLKVTYYNASISNMDTEEFDLEYQGVPSTKIKPKVTTMTKLLDDTLIDFDINLRTLPDAPTSPIEIEIPDPRVYPDWKQKLTPKPTGIPDAPEEPEEPATPILPFTPPVPVPKPIPTPIPTPSLDPPITVGSVPTTVNEDTCGCKMAFSLGKPWQLAIPFLEIFKSVVSFLAKLFGFLLVIPLVESVPIQNDAFAWFRTANFGGVPLYDTIMSMVTLFISLGIFRVVKRITGG